MWIGGARPSVSFRTLDEARNYRDEVKRARREAAKQNRQPLVTTRAPAQTLTAFVRERWWKEYAKDNLAQRTRDNYYSHFKRFVAPAPLGALDVTKLDTEHIHEWQEWARNRGATDASLRTAQKVISGALSWGAEMPRTRGVPANPVSSAKWPKEARTHDVHVYGPEVVERIRVRILRGGGSADQRQRDALLLSLMSQTGMRPSEAREVQVHNVGKTTINLQKTKTGKPRTIPLWAPLKKDIATWVKAAGLGPTDFIVGQLTGEQMSFDGWENWRDRAYKPARDHVAKRPLDERLEKARAYDLCRHSYAAQQLAALMSLARLAEIMGHSPEVLSRHYAQSLEERQGQRKPVNPERAVIAARKQVADSRERLKPSP